MIEAVANLTADWTLGTFFAVAVTLLGSALLMLQHDEIVHPDRHRKGPRK